MTSNLATFGPKNSYYGEKMSSMIEPQSDQQFNSNTTLDHSL